MQISELNMKARTIYSLCLLDGVRHGEEDAVEQNGGHDDVVKVRVSRQVDGDPPQRVPRREEETGARRRETVDVILTEPFRHHHKRLAIACAQQSNEMK